MGVLSAITYAVPFFSDICSFDIRVVAVCLCVCVFVCVWKRRERSIGFLLLLVF